LVDERAFSGLPGRNRASYTFSWANITPVLREVRCALRRNRANADGGRSAESEILRCTQPIRLFIEEDTMVSMWWVLAAFLMGGSAGLLGFSLIGMAHREGEHGGKAERTFQRDATLKLHKDWMGHHYWSATFE